MHAWWRFYGTGPASVRHSLRQHLTSWTEAKQLAMQACMCGYGLDPRRHDAQD